MSWGGGKTYRKRLEKAEKLWMKSVEDAGYKYIKGKLIKRLREKEEEKEKAASSTETVQEAEESGVQFSRSKSFSQQVDDVLSGADTENSHLRLMSKTPKLLQDAGLPDLPILMTAKHLKSITGKGDRGNQHTLSISTVKNLPQYLADPVMIMDSLTRDDSVVIFVEESDQEGRPVVCAVKLDGRGNLGNIEVSANIMTSAYGKDNFQSFIDRNAANDTVFYWNEKKTRALFNTPGLQLPDNIERLASNTIIRKAKAFVNTSSKKSSESSGTAQFSLPKRSEPDGAQAGDVTRVNSEKMQVTQSVDNSAGMRYNGDNQNNEKEVLYDDREGAPSSNGARTPQSAQSDEGARKTNERGSGISPEVRETSERNERVLVLRRATEEHRLKEKAFPRDDYISPKSESVDGYVQKKLQGYGVDSFVVKRNVWNRKGAAFAHDGIVYIREGLTARDRVILVPHEITHVMEEMKYPPYMDFLSQTPSALDFSSAAAEELLKAVSAHCECDYYDASVDEFQKIYDELNSTAFGHYAAGDGSNPEYATRFKERIFDAFKDFDSYISELDRIHAQFKEDIIEARRTLDESDSIQFSIPKRKSDGARAKQNANREGSNGTQKYYLREEIATTIKDFAPAGQYSHALRLKSELFDLRAGNANLALRSPKGNRKARSRTTMVHQNE